MKNKSFRVSFSVRLHGYGFYLTNNFPPGSRVDKTRVKIWRGWWFEVIKP